MTGVKICGIKNAIDRDCVVSTGVNAIGFVVEVERSRRKISREEARALIEGLPPFTTSVIVIEPVSTEEAAELAGETGADVIQVHGGINAAEIADLKAAIPQRVVAAMAVSSASEEEEAHSLAEVADALLLDTFSNGKTGGTGEVHDWNFSANLVRSLDVPVILAGGLDTENVAQAVRKVRPYAVDVSSGVETDGKKDHQKIRDFVRTVRSCQPQ